MTPSPSAFFPDANLAPAQGPVACGGDLNAAMLVDAYAHGIFPWFNDDHEPVMWWSPDPRAVLTPTRMRVSKSLRKRLRSEVYEVTADSAFAKVLAGCAGPRQGQTDTWITPRMRDAYQALFALGLAHSVEAWHDGRLVGGLYGVSLGRMFFGESMFSHAPDASKVALAWLARQLAAWRFTLIDCQFMTEHLRRLGAVIMRRREFLNLVRGNNEAPTTRGRWRFDAVDWRAQPSA